MQMLVLPPLKTLKSLISTRAVRVTYHSNLIWHQWNHEQLCINFSNFAAIMSPTAPSCWAWTTWRCQRCPWQWDNARWRRTSAQCGGHDLQPAWRDRGSSRARQTPRGWQRWRSNPGEDTHKHTNICFRVPSTTTSKMEQSSPIEWNLICWNSF